MNNDVIVKGLIELYEERGLDLHLLIDDPLFEKLPPEDRVRIIKRYAEKLSSHSGSVITKNDIKRTLMSALGSGIATAVPMALAAGSSIVKDPSTRKMALVATGIGAGLGAVSGYLGSRREANNNSDFRKQLEVLKSSGRNEDAVKVIALRNIQNRGIGSSVYNLPTLGSNMVKGIRNGIVEGRVQTIQYDKDLSAMANDFKQTAPGSEEEAVLGYKYQQMKEQASKHLDTINSSVFSEAIKNTLKGL